MRHTISFLNSDVKALGPKIVTYKQQTDRKQMFDMTQSEIMLYDGNSTLLLCYYCCAVKSSESRDVEKVQKTNPKC